VGVKVAIIIRNITLFPFSNYSYKTCSVLPICKKKDIIISALRKRLSEKIITIPIITIILVLKNHFTPTIINDHMNWLIQQLLIDEKFIVEPITVRSYNVGYQLNRNVQADPIGF